MRPKTNRLLMLLISAMLAGCASQTERSSSGGGAEKAQAPAPAYEPQSDGVQFVDRPLEEAPPPAQVAKAPRKTTYEDEAEEDLGVLGAEVDESSTLEDEEEDLVAMDSVADEPEEELGDLGAEADESSTLEDEEEDLVAMDSVADEPEEELGDLGAQPDDSGTLEEEEELAATAAMAEETEDEVGDLGTQPDESGTMQDAEEDLAATDSVVDEPQEEAEQPAEEADEPAEAAGEPVQVAEKPAAVAEKPVARAPVSVSFEAEPLFSFDKSVIRDDQRSKLDAFVASLKGTRYDSIEVVGHADSIGTEQYNLDLSRRRADAVKTYLARLGVPTGKINVAGRGESEPVTAGACRRERGKALIACLQPDRRVDVSVTATKPAS
ncbi:MAG: OmpA family protein [Betaproteobacteria bacterium]